MLAHEMGHQVQHHPMRGLVRSLGLRLISGGGARWVLGDCCIWSTLLERSCLVCHIVGRMKPKPIVSGSTMLTRANIRGDGLIDFFTRYQGGNEASAASHREANSTQNHVMAFLSTHPPGHERISLIRPLMLGKHDALTAAQWKAVQAICDGES